MKNSSEVEVLCLYYSYTGRETNYYEISNGIDSIDEDDFIPTNFWASLGGFSITIDGFYTIFTSHNFYNMVKATSFLISSIYWLQGKKSDWFDIDGEDVQIDIKFGLNELLTMKKADSDNIVLSYLSVNDGLGKKRGSHFFDGVYISKKVWIKAVSIALNEYFTVLENIVADNPEDKNCKLMSAYYNTWQLVNNSI